MNDKMFKGNMIEVRINMSGRRLVVKSEVTSYHHTIIVICINSILNQKLNF